MTFPLHALLTPPLYLGLVYVSVVLVVHFVPDRSLSTRTCAVYVVSCWIASMLFQALIGVGAFHLLPALFATTSLAACARLLSMRLGITLDLPQPSIPASRPTTKLGAGALAAVAIVSLARVLFLPLLGWDSLTYHGLKAGLWAQSGTGITYDAPGAWEYYRYFFGGGESLTAWAMMPLGSDTLAGLPDWFHWIALGVATYALARQLRVPPSSAFLSAAILLTAPATLSYVGSGYVDTQQNACSLIAILFLGRWSANRDDTAALLIAGAALGLAVGTKTSAIPLAGALAAFAVGRVFWEWNHRSHPSRDTALFAMALSLPSLYWCITNYADYGYPLGVAPIAIGPIRLGVPTPGLSPLLNTDLSVIPLKTQVIHLWFALRPFGGFLLFPLAALLSLRRGTRRSSTDAVLALSAAATLGFYFAPDFSFIRIMWARVNARFLVTAIVPLGMLGLASMPAKARERIVGIVSILAITAHVYVYADRLLRTAPAAEMIAIAAGTITMAAIAAVAVRLWQTRLDRRVWAVVTMLVVSVGIVSLHSVRPWVRGPAYASSDVLHVFPRYWVRGLAALDETPGSKKIAMTADPMESSQNWFVYPFLGANLENQVTHISPLRDGEPDFAVWMNRLRDEGVTHVMSFRPRSVELDWMAGEHASHFTRIDGTPNRWGLFRVRQHHDADAAACW